WSRCLLGGRHADGLPTRLTMGYPNRMDVWPVWLHGSSHLCVLPNLAAGGCRCSRCSCPLLRSPRPLSLAGKDRCLGMVAGGRLASAAITTEFGVLLLRYPHPTTVPGATGNTNERSPPSVRCGWTSSGFPVSRQRHGHSLSAFTGSRRCGDRLFSASSCTHSDVYCRRGSDISGPVGCGESAADGTPRVS